MEISEVEKILNQTGEENIISWLGIKVLEAVPREKVVLSMPVTPRVHQYIGIMNGGVSLVLAETAASIGAVISEDLTKSAPVGIEINANHLRAVSRGTLRVEAVPVLLGKTVHVWQVEIRDGRGKLTCLSRCTLSIRNRPAARRKE